jgi:hypothetical protein
MVDHLAPAAIAATQPSVAINRTLDLVGPVSLPERKLVERATGLLGRQVQVVRFQRDCFQLRWPFANASPAPGFP